MTLDEYEAQSAAWLRAQAEIAQDEAMDEAMTPDDDDLPTFDDLFAPSWFDAHFEDGDE